MSFATTASILLCIVCTRIIITSLFDGHDIVIRAASGLLAGLAVHLAAPPRLLDGGGRHRIDDPSITTAFTFLSLYGCFDILVAQHIIWAIFPLLGWTISFVVHPSSHTRSHRSAESRSRVAMDINMTVATQKSHRSRVKNDPRTEPGFNENGLPGVRVAQSISQNANCDTDARPNLLRSTSDGFTQQAGTSQDPEHRSTRNYSDTVNRPRTGSSRVTFVDTASWTLNANREKSAINSEGAREVIVSGTARALKQPNLALEEPMAPVIILPLTRNNIRQIARSPKPSDHDEIDGQESTFDENLTFHTAESTHSETESSESESQYTIARTTARSRASSSTARAPSVNNEGIVGSGPYIHDIDDSDTAEESNSDAVDNALVLFSGSRNQATDPTELRPQLIPQDYISQTYVRVEKFVSAVDGVELAEQIEVIPGEPQESSYDKDELRRRKKYLESLLTYEPSETSSSTTVRLSEVEGNVKAIDRRAEEYRRKSLEAKRKISALGEKRKIALQNQRSEEAFRIKCVMQEYQKEADREDKKAAKLYFRARNKPGARRIDVHSLKKEEALKAAEKALREVQLKGGHELHVIVGQGLHSAGGQPILKPYLRSAFLAQKMRVYESSSNPGVLVINMKS